MAQYINKETLVKKIRKRLLPVVAPQGVSYDDWEHGADSERLNILALIDELKVKEVDLDFQRFAKEMEIVFALPSSKTENKEEEPLNWEYAIAKHFYELGLKAQKGE